MSINYGSKEHTQFAYEVLRTSGTKTIIEFMRWLKEHKRLEHLKGMELTNLEIRLIEDIEKGKL